MRNGSRMQEAVLGHIFLLAPVEETAVSQPVPLNYSRN
jgi:hypothetical protein